MQLHLILLCSHSYLSISICISFSLFFLTKQIKGWECKRRKSNGGEVTDYVKRGIPLTAGNMYRRKHPLRYVFPRDSATWHSRPTCPSSSLSRLKTFFFLSSTLISTVPPNLITNKNKKHRHKPVTNAQGRRKVLCFPFFFSFSQKLLFHEIHL